jgi:protein PET117
MHAGVVQDEAKQRVKRERQADFELQRQLEEEYRKIQHVSDPRSSQNADGKDIGAGS